MLATRFPPIHPETLSARIATKTGLAMKAVILFTACWGVLVLPW